VFTPNCPDGNLREEGEQRGVSEFAATARDENGRRVMSARISFTITDQ
jgi:hypothetical protein